MARRRSRARLTANSAGNTSPLRRRPRISRAERSRWVSPVFSASRSSASAGSPRSASCGRNSSIRRPTASDFAVAEDPLGGGIEGEHDTEFIQRQHHVLDVVQDDLQVIGALLLRLEGQRARLIGHELHGAHHPAAFLIDRGVVTG